MGFQGFSVPCGLPTLFGSGVVCQRGTPRLLPTPLDTVLPLSSTLGWPVTTLGRAFTQGWHCRNKPPIWGGLDLLHWVDGTALVEICFNDMCFLLLTGILKFKFVSGTFLWVFVLVVFTFSPHLPLIKFFLNQILLTWKGPDPPGWGDPACQRLFSGQNFSAGLRTEK